HSHDIAKLEKNLQHAELDNAKRTLHTLEGVSGNIGAHSLQQASKDLHFELTKEGNSPLPHLPDAYRQTFAELFNGLRNFLEESASSDTPVTDAASPMPGESQVSIDKLITSLDDMLAMGDPDAKRLFQSLNQLLKQKDAVDLTNRLGSQIRDYDFDLARESLAALRAHLGEE
ncbi:MAG: hypothetical protein B6D79_01675, partial [gamma proteobacterium symbiont of Ctena orbiculata]